MLDCESPPSTGFSTASNGVNASPSERRPSSTYQQVQLAFEKEVGYARNQKCFSLCYHCQSGCRGVHAAKDYSKGISGSGRPARQFIRDTLRAKQRRGARSTVDE